ncbi:MAG: right-handed parallel beta-helix repeat-containing protein [Oscillochloris sp.]|nr:right-handed parallel beta-helix repeat-containing protein [Oscillochloris sp.]
MVQPRLLSAVVCFLASVWLGACSGLAESNPEAAALAPSDEPPAAPTLAPPASATPAPTVPPTIAPDLLPTVPPTLVPTTATTVAPTIQPVEINAGPAVALTCPAPAASPGASTNPRPANVVYNAEANTIQVQAGEPTTLAAVAAALNQPELLREIAPGEWLLGANLQIDPGAELTIAGPEVRRLKLRSEPAYYIWLKALGGNLNFSDTCVSSWDPTRAALDSNPADGRSYVLARDGATMHIRNSMLHHLGYLADESYGVSYRLPGTGGEIVNSDLSYNYYGFYSFEVDGLVIRNNDVHHNVLYGIDPHTGSEQLLIEGNRVYANGKHGIILADACNNSIIRSNSAYDNGEHGIVLYDDSNHNLVAGNVAYNNGLQGININSAAHNVIRGNTTYANGSDGIGVGQQAADNLLEENMTYQNRAHGIHLYSEARNTMISANIVANNAEYGIYVKSPANHIGAGNRIYGNEVGHLPEHRGSAADFDPAE